MKTIILILCFIFTSPAFAGDYIIYNKDGEITRKYRSVDGADLRVRKDCLKVDREVFNSIDKYSKIKNGKIIRLSQNEITLLEEQQKAEQLAEKALLNSLRKSTERKFKTLGFTDEEITLIFNTRF